LTAYSVAQSPDLAAEAECDQLREENRQLRAQLDHRSA
jgi:hypothetical protein